MDNLIFQAFDNIEHSYNPIILNLLSSSDNVSSVTNDNILDYNHVLLDVNNCAFKLNELENYNNENYYKEKILKYNIDQTKKYIIPAILKTIDCKNFKNKVFTVEYNNPSWSSYYSIIKTKSKSFNIIFNYGIESFDIDTHINSRLQDKIILKTKNFAYEIINFICNKYNAKHSVDYYLNFFIGKPIELVYQAIVSGPDRVLENYEKILIRKIGPYTIKKTECDNLVVINFDELFYSGYTNGLGYYKEVCEKIDISQNIDFFTSIHKELNADYYNIFANENAVIRTILKNYNDRSSNR